MSAVTLAGVMELADVVDSKSTGSDTVPVRVRPPAPNTKDHPNGWSFVFHPAAKTKNPYNPGGIYRTL